MLSIILIALLALYFIVISWKLKSCFPEERTIKITKYVSKIIKLSPIIGSVIFTILFTFVLKGRIIERSTHALVIFAIWLYATQFYQYILAFFKKRVILICSIIGMIYSILLAIILTPLEQYISLVYSHMSYYSIFLGCGLLIILYTVIFVVMKKLKTD